MENEVAEGAEVDDCVVDYDTLMRLSIDLDNNRCPKGTKIITGSSNEVIIFIDWSVSFS